MDKNIRGWVAIIGAVIFAFGIFFSFYLFSQVVKAEFASITSGYTPPPYIPNLERLRCPGIMAENDSEPIVAEFSNPLTRNLDATITLGAPAFEVSPSGPVDVVIPADGVVEMTWIISPEKMGNQSAVVTAFSDAGQAKPETCGIAVTNTFGLSGKQAQYLGLLSTFLGSALSLPWLYDKWQQYKRDKKTQQAREKQHAEIEKLKKQVEELTAQQTAKRWWQFWK